MQPKRSSKFTLVLAFAVALPLVAQLQPERTIILIGPPGSGKTVQAQALSKAYKIPDISMAELLRREVNKKSPMAKLLQSSLDSVLADGPANDLMQARLLRPDAGRGFILDGYPTSEGQAKAFDQFLSEHKLPKPTIVVLNVPEDVSRNRLTQRRKVGDEPINIERRLQDYRVVGRLVEQWYGAERIVRVDGTGTPAEVTMRITKGIDGVPDRARL